MGRTVARCLDLGVRGRLDGRVDESRPGERCFGQRRLTVRGRNGHGHINCRCCSLRRRWPRGPGLHPARLDGCGLVRLRTSNMARILVLVVDRERRLG